MPRVKMQVKQVKATGITLAEISAARKQLQSELGSCRYVPNGGGLEEEITRFVEVVNRRDSIRLRLEALDEIENGVREQMRRAEAAEKRAEVDKALKTIEAKRAKVLSELKGADDPLAMMEALNRLAKADREANEVRGGR